MSNGRCIASLVEKEGGKNPVIVGDRIKLAVILEIIKLSFFALIVVGIVYISWQNHINEPDLWLLSERSGAFCIVMFCLLF